MRYAATYYVRGQREPRERTFNTIDGALRFLVLGMHDGKHFPGYLTDRRGQSVASHEWILDHWREIYEVLAQDRPPSAHPAVRSLQDR